MSIQHRIVSLSDRHAKLETDLERESLRAAPRDLVIKRIKLEKLRLKDEMDRLRSTS